MSSWDVPAKLKTSLRAHERSNGRAAGVNLNESNALLPQTRSPSADTDLLGQIRQYLHDGMPSGKEEPGKSYLCVSRLSSRGAQRKQTRMHVLNPSES